MKVICAGFQKTGTKSLSRALEMLGYKGEDFFPAVIIIDRSGEIFLNLGSF